MTRAAIAGVALATALLLLLALVGGYRFLERTLGPATATSPAIAPATAPAAAETPPAAEESQGFLYGRITTVDGVVHEGRLRWGGDEEAFWGELLAGGCAR